MPTIIPKEDIPSHKTGYLPDRLTVEDITQVVGFGPNVSDEEDKVTASWGFTVDGFECAIWDYKGERWSVYDPNGALVELFRGIARVTKD